MSRSAKSTVFINPIPKACTQAMLKELSKDCVSSRIPFNSKNQTNRSYAFLEYKDETTASKWAQQLNGKLFNGVELHAKLAANDDFDVASLNTRQLFITNLAKDATKEEVATLFKTASSVKVPTLKDKSTAGYAFADFTDPADALKTLKALQGATVRGRQIKVTFGRSQNYKKQRIEENKKRYAEIKASTTGVSEKQPGQANQTQQPAKAKPPPQSTQAKQPQQPPKQAVSAPAATGAQQAAGGKKKKKNKNKKIKQEQA